ncbi:response regulator [Bacillus sp. JJ722]|uniref:response regulator n=1 Tax=Bacillus sp. JJ722 TaxID=3122973 RepID=UPI002FFDF06E
MNDCIEILIIEDDLRIASIQKTFIERMDGFQVVGIATNHQDAEMFMEIYKPQLILLDVYFPDMNGLQFLKNTKQSGTQIDVIMITATKELDKIQEAITIGVFDYIIKPVLFDRFQQSLLRYKQYRQKLQDLKKEPSAVTQQAIDQLFSQEKKQQEKAFVPKGIDPLTLEKVLDVISIQSNGYNAEGIAEKIGVSRTTARRYLEHLVGEEKLKADLVYGTVGRPERVYKRIVEK